MTLVAEPQTRFGHYAGPVTRAIAFLADVAISVVVFEAAVAITLELVNIVFQADVHTDDVPAWVAALVFAAWLVVYFGGSWAASGKTVGMALVGIRVVADDGSALGRWRGLLRAPSLALSLLTFGIGLVGIVVGRHHRGLQDVMVGSVVVYDWDARAARLRFLARNPDPRRVVD